MKHIKFPLIIGGILLITAFSIYTVQQFVETISTETLWILASIYICKGVLMGFIRIMWLVMKMIIMISLIIYIMA